MKYVPWGLSVVLVTLLLFVFMSKNQEINNLNQQNAALTEKYNRTVAEANQKQQQLVVEANQKQQQLIGEANQKQQQLIGEANQKQQQLIGEANQLLVAASLPEATVAITFRPARLGSGFVATITNTSGGSIPVTIEVSRPSTGQTKTYDYVMDGGRVSEIGHREGWAFVSGDVVNIKQPAHKVKTSTLR